MEQIVKTQTESDKEQSELKLDKTSIPNGYPSVETLEELKEGI